MDPETTPYTPSWAPFSMSWLGAGEADAGVADRLSARVSMAPIGRVSRLDADDVALGDQDSGAIAAAIAAALAPTAPSPAAARHGSQHAPAAPPRPPAPGSPRTRPRSPQGRPPSASYPRQPGAYAGQPPPPRGTVPSAPQRSMGSNSTGSAPVGQYPGMTTPYTMSKPGTDPYAVPSPYETESREPSRRPGPPPQVPPRRGSAQSQSNLAIDPMALVSIFVSFFAGPIGLLLAIASLRRAQKGRLNPIPSVAALVIAGISTFAGVGVFSALLGSIFGG